jgi:regulator of sigma E protease
VTLAREGAEFTVDVKSKVPFDLGDSLGYPSDPVFVGDISHGMPAYAAGMKEGDEIVAINGTPVVSWMQCVYAIRGSKGEELKIDLKREEQTLQVSVKPVLGRSDLGGSAWQIGFRNRPNVVYHKMAALPAMREAYERTVDTSGLILNTVGMLVTGRVALREMSGVIGISHEAGQAAKRGPIDLILLMASISLNLGILNLLPIPILDGGHLLLLSVEGIRRRDLSLAVKERFVQVGMVFLLVVFAIVMYNDVLKLLPRR